MSVNIFQGSFDLAQEFTIFRSYGTKLRFEAVICICADILDEAYFLDIQLILDDLHKELRYFKRCFYIHIADRLSVFDICTVSCRTAKYNDFQYFCHIFLKFRIDHCLVNNREVTQMDTFRSIFINTSYQVLVNIFCHERNHRSGCLADRYQCGIQCHIRIDLILLHAFCPETLTASSDIPVTHLIYELL